MNQSIKQLHYFECIASHKSLSAAAEELKISQPALTTSLQKIETSLGFDLFNREGRSLTLNDAGKALLPCVQELLRSHQQIVHKAVDLRSQKKQDITAFVNSSPWAIKLKMRALGTPDLYLNGENFFSFLEKNQTPASCLGIVNYFMPFTPFDGFHLRSVETISEYTLLCPKNVNLDDIGKTIETKVLMPDNSLISGIEERSSSITELFKLNHLEISHFDCFDTMISSCSLSKNIVIVPGKKAFWKDLYGRYLGCGETVKSKNNDQKMHLGIAYTADIPESLIDSLANNKANIAPSN